MTPDGSAPAGAVDGQRRGMRPRMGPLELAFVVVAAAGPLLVVAGFAPLAFMIGGVGAPGAQLVAALVLVVFAVGLSRMTQRIRNAGAFYAYIGAGLGRPLGGGAAALALGAYSVIAIGQLGAVGAFAQGPLSELLGLDLPWPFWSFTALTVVALLGHRRVTLSARVLGVVLLLEVAILLALAVPVLAGGGAEGIDLAPFEPSEVFSGPGTGAMFAIAFGAFIGFESTAIYAEEARDPGRTVPRAMFLSIGFLGLFYTVMAWVVYLAFGRSGIVEAATDDPVGLVTTAVARYVGAPAVTMLELLLVTSAFASTLAFHTTATRYLFTLSRESVLPTVLSAVHPRHGSPHRASALQSALAGVALALFVVAGADPYLHVFLVMVAPGVLTVVILQALCSLAVLVYFAVGRGHGLGRCSTCVAPTVSLIALAVASWLIASNFELLSGRADWVNLLLLATLPMAFALGMSRALWLRRHNRAAYAHLTRTELF